MGYKALDVNVISAKDLKSVNLFTKMDVYAVVSISGDSQKQEFKTPVNHDAGSNPTWNFPIKFTVDDSLAHQNRLSIVFNIKSKRILGDKNIGEVIVPVKELIDGKLPQFLSYKVRTPTGNSKGLLHFSYKFGDVVPAAAAKFNEPGTAYPVAGSSFAPYAAGTPYPQPPAVGYPYPPPQNGGYPSQPQGYGYPPPPQHPGYGVYPAQGGYWYRPPPPQHPGYGVHPAQGGYWYPPPPPQHPGYGAYPAQGGYWYPPVQQQQQAPKKNKLGMVLRSWLLGGKLGLWIGDMVSRMEDMDAYEWF